MKNIRVVIFNWRKEENVGEFTGLNTGLMYLLELLGTHWKIDNVVMITSDKMESIESKGIAGLRKISSRILGPTNNVTNTLRELRFSKMKCREDKLDGEVVIIDHIRALLMASRCLSKFKNKLNVLHVLDYFEEYPLAKSYMIEYFRKLLIKNVKQLIDKYIDIIILNSRRDLYIYTELFPKKTIIYLPTIYLPTDYVPCSHKKPEDKLIINVVHRSNVSNEFVNILIKYIQKQFDTVLVRSIGKPIPGAQYVGWIPTRKDFLDYLSEGHAGINFSAVYPYQSGTNVKRYDYALACNVVLTQSLSVTGEQLPFEIVFVDEYDLLAKLYDKDIQYFINGGKENLKYALELREKSIKNFVDTFSKFI